MILILLLSCNSAPSFTRAALLTSMDESIGGPKASAQIGDFLLENDRVRFAILAGGNSFGPSVYGGTLVDADLRRADPAYGAGHGKDAFVELFATVNMNLIAADEPSDVTIISDGTDGTAIIRADEAGAPFLELLGALWGLPDIKQPDFRITTDYILKAGSPALELVTTASFTDPGTELPVATAATGGSELPLLDLALFDGLSFGDFYLQGGSVDVFAAGLGFDEEAAVFEKSQRGENTFQDPFAVDFVAGVADGVSYALASSTGPIHIPMFTSSQTAAFGAGVESTEAEGRFPAGAAYSYHRWLGVGKGDVGSAFDAIIEASGAVHGDVSGFVVEEGTGVALPHVSVLVFRKDAGLPWSQWETDVGDDSQPDGSFGGHLLPGDWELVVHSRGRPAGPRVPITVVADQEVQLVLTSPRAGQVTVRVVDELDRAIPSKLTFIRKDGAALLPDYGDPYIAGEPAEVVFLPHGEGRLVLPPGSWEAVASRGMEYEIDRVPFTLSASDTVELELQVIRSVDTPGAFAADFHVHAINSFDSGTVLSDRVVTMVAEGVEFFTSTDHDFLTDYAPTVEDLGLEPWVKTAVGLETTTLEVGHFIGFPLQADTLVEAGGAFDWSGMTPGEIFSEFETLGVQAGTTPVRMVAHPRDGILGYFDQYGWDPYTGQVEFGILSLFNPLLAVENFSLDFDALELLNGKRFEILRTPTQAELDSYAADTSSLDNYALVSRTAAEQTDLAKGTYTLGYGHEGQIDDWFTLLNAGTRLTALGNSDSHGKYSVEAGCPRNYVFMDADEPTELEPQAVAEAVRAGHVVASYGPYVEFSINDPANIVGTELVDTDGSVDLNIRVQAPTWMAVDRVEIYQNGTLIQEWTGLPAEGTAVLRVDETVSVAVTQDSWFVIIVMGDDDLAPLFTPVEFPPVQLADVVTDALSDLPTVSDFLPAGVPIPRTGAVMPFAVTNPIWVDVDGSGFTPPGIPSWLVPPIEPG